MFVVVTKECIHCKQTGTVMVDEEKYREFKQGKKKYVTFFIVKKSK